MSMDLSKLLASVKNKRAEIESRKTNTTTKKIPGGKSRWRILPGWRKASPEVFFHSFGQHWIKDEDGKPIVVYVCDRVTFGTPCDICDVISTAMKSTKDDKALETFKSMRAGARILVNAIQMTGEGADTAVAGLLPLPNTVFEAYLSQLETYAEEGVNLLDLKEGRDIIIDKTGSGMMNTKYAVGVAPTSTKVADSILDSVTDIDAYIAGQRADGVTKGPALLNGRVSSLLSLSGPSSRSLLTGGGGTQNMSTAGMLSNTKLDDEIPFLTNAGDGGAAGISDEEVANLLKSLED